MISYMTILWLTYGDRTPGRTADQRQAIHEPICYLMTDHRRAPAEKRK